ncbi:hypothetical protein DSECCO2_477150 [anaerobic digester metagenome]
MPTPSSAAPSTTLSPPLCLSTANVAPCNGLPFWSTFTILAETSGFFTTVIVTVAKFDK